MRTAEEIAWERQQRNDTNNDQLLIPLLLRDGSSCRWCGCVVYRGGRPSGRELTVDHLMPRQPATVDTLVIACKRCNSERGGNREKFDAEHTLLPPPLVPLQGKWSAKKLTAAGYPTEPGQGVMALHDTSLEETSEVSRSVKTEFVGPGRDGSGRDR